MPEISLYCPGCGRSVNASGESPTPVTVMPASLDALLGALSYLTIVPAVILLLIPGTSRKRFVRFHAWQSILFSLAAALIALATRVAFGGLSYLALGALLAWLLIGIVFLAIVFAWALLVLKAALGEAYELPWLGRGAELLANRE